MPVSYQDRSILIFVFSIHTAGVLGLSENSSITITILVIYFDGLFGVGFGSMYWTIEYLLLGLGNPIFSDAYFGNSWGRKKI